MNKSIKSIRLKDLAFVFLYGIVLSILFGIMIGMVDIIIKTYVLSGISLSFIFFFLSSRWLGREIGRQYDYPHIVYVVIAFIGLFIQAVIVLVFQMFNPIIIDHPEVFLDERIYIEGFITLLRFMFTGSFLSSMRFMISFLFMGVGIYIGLRETY